MGIKPNMIACSQHYSKARPYNEADYGATSTMTAILGRMASYSGQVITYEDALNSQVDLCPESMNWDADTKVNPGEDGLYACAMPGKTKRFRQML